MPQIVKLPRRAPMDLEQVPADKREAVDQILSEFYELVRANPLMGFDPFPRQELFLGAGRVRAKMAVAGNRAGKTEIGVVDDLIQCVDLEALPEWLRPFKVWEPPFKLRVVTMDLSATLYGVMIPKWQKLTPREQLRGGSWDSAFDKTHRVLRFANGSSVQFMSADQDREKHAGADLDRVHFDEEPPPPNGYGIYQENRRRLIDRSGQLMFTMTPLLGLSWTYDEIWNRREEDGVTVVQWSMTDNPHLPKEAVDAEIARCTSEKERRAVINGDFVHFRGRVLEGFETDRHVVDPPTKAFVGGLDTIIGYDPGLSRSGLVWIGFDRENRALIYDELYLQSVPLAYWATDRQGMAVVRPFDEEKGEQPSIFDRVNAKNRLWGVRPLYWVIDPASRIRDMTSAAESVQSALVRAQVSVIPGDNDRLAGVLQMQGRIESDALKVSSSCESWLREADRWLVAEDEDSMEQRPKSSVKGATFKTIGPDHLMDPTRYVCMNRAWGSGVGGPGPSEPNRFQAGEAIPARYLQPRPMVGPLGSMA